MKKLTVTSLLVSEQALNVPTGVQGLWSSNDMKKLTVTKLLVSEGSPECPDLRLKSMEQ